MIDRIVVSYPELCTGCRQCELTCSYVHEGVYSPGLSRIRLVRFEGEGLSVPVTCVYCRRPYCEEVCPTGAMTHDPQTGTAVVLEARCIGCKECVGACPIGAADVPAAKDTAIRCDLCGGDPACVKACPTGALKFESIGQATREKRRGRVKEFALVMDATLGREER
jgi:Fe-S-cluster-containing hydrogenase component 2